MSLRYWIVDAFTKQLFRGNPAAVVLPGMVLPDATMQAIAAENNLSETAFAVPEADVWHLRWFTPTLEVDLCGHATLATAFVLAREGHPPPYRFQTRSGLLLADLVGDRIVLNFPARPNSPADIPEGLAEALGVAPVAAVQSADLIAVMDSPETVIGLRPDIARIGALSGGRLIVTAAGGAEADITSRFFAPGFGIDEDAVTGSLHTQVVPYWAERLGVAGLVCHQASARGGMLWCEAKGDRVTMAGHAALYAIGELMCAI